LQVSHFETGRRGSGVTTWVWYSTLGSARLFRSNSYQGGDVMTIDQDGNVTITGNINAKYQDVAEWVPTTTNLAPGTVVIIDTDKSNAVRPSEHAYDTAVASVVSERPGLALGEPSPGKQLIATTGRVRVKVSAKRGRIRVGDLLVTSDSPGVAMKSVPMNVAGRSFHQPGTMLGKALEPLDSGEGEILVLLTLQ
jgi:hypothetical protein